MNRDLNRYSIRCYSFFLSCLLFKVIATIADPIQETFTVSRKTEYIYKRFYFIERLKKTVAYLEHFDKLPSNAIVTLETDHTFTHVCIKESVEYIKKTHSLQPVAISWHEFAHYKYLEDEQFLDEFTKLILILSKNILLCIQPRNALRYASADVWRELYQRGLSACAHDRLFYIDLLLQNNDLQQKNISQSLEEYKPFFYTQSVSYHYYALMRLKPHFTQICKRKKTVMATLCHTPFTPHHPIISTTIQRMKDAYTFDPLASLWQELSHYKYMHEELISKELSFIMLMVYTYLAEHNKEAESLPATRLNYIYYLYEHLNQVPLEEILDALDTLAHDLPLLNQKYELDSNLTWRQWFRKYWWAPPITLGSFGIKLLIFIKQYKQWMATSS